MNSFLRKQALVLLSLAVFLVSTPAGFFAAEEGTTAPQKTVKRRGHVEAFSMEERKIVIDELTYQLAEDIIVSRHGIVMEPRQYNSLKFVDLIEYTFVSGTRLIREIVIISYAS